MLQTGGERDLTPEALGAERRGQIGVEQLERDGAIVFGVARQVHGRHAATPKLALEEVPTLKRALQQLPRVAG